MTNSSITIALNIAYYDSEADATLGKEVVLATPRLDFFSSAAVAAARNEGLSIVEADLWFFSSNGSPLEARFSEPPSITTEKRTYFPGIYTLHPATGESLSEAIARIIARNPSPHATIVVPSPTTEQGAVAHGWRDPASMKVAVERTLRILPPELAQRIRFESAAPMSTGAD